MIMSNLGMRYKRRANRITVRFRDNPNEYARQYYRLIHGKRNLQKRDRKSNGKAK